MRHDPFAREGVDPIAEWGYRLSHKRRRLEREVWLWRLLMLAGLLLAVWGSVR